MYSGNNNFKKIIEHITFKFQIESEFIYQVLGSSNACKSRYHSCSFTRDV